MSPRVVWVSGHRATFARTVDGGDTWVASVVEGAEDLQFRDVAAFDERTAYLMSSGPGEQSRIYRTDDGGGSWRLQYTAEHPDAFLDCMDFWTPERGLAYGDAVDGVPFLLATTDGGERWSRVPAASLPPALEGEGGFAASGTCLQVLDGGLGWVATGNGARARVLRTADFGASWTAVDVPVVSGAAAGLATIRMDARGRGVAMGGIIGDDSVRSDNVALTEDGGATWTVGGALVMAGPVYGSALSPAGDVVVAVGPGGMDWSPDGGRTWRSADTLTYWAAALASSEVGWAVGPGGRIVRVTVAAR